MRIGPCRRGITFFLAAFCAEVFHRLVIQQGIDGPVQRAAIQIVHLLAQLGPPFGNPARHRDIGDHGETCGSDEFPSEIDIENQTHRDQFDHGRSNVEQQKIEHGIDALGPALNRLGNFAGAPRQMEPQAQLVQALKNVLGQLTGRVLSHTFECNVA